MNTTIALEIPSFRLRSPNFVDRRSPGSCWAEGQGMKRKELVYVGLLTYRGKCDKGEPQVWQKTFYCARARGGGGKDT